MNKSFSVAAFLLVLLLLLGEDVDSYPNPQFSSYPQEAAPQDSSPFALQSLSNQYPASGYYPSYQYQYPSYQYPAYQYPSYQYPAYQYPSYQYPAYQYPSSSPYQSYSSYRTPLLTVDGGPVSKSNFGVLGGFYGWCRDCSARGGR